MNLRESVEKAAETINQKQPCASEAYCLLTEALECPDITPEEMMDDFGIEVVENAPVLL